MRRGGASRPSVLCALAVGLVMTLSTPLAAAPRTEDELITLVRTAIEKQDYDAIEPLVNWQGSGPRNKRLVAMQIRHGLGRPVKSIKLEAAGPDVTEQVGAQHPDFQINMPITHILRIAFGDGEGQAGQGDPGTVFLIGQSAGEFRIALVVRKPESVK